MNKEYLINVINLDERSDRWQLIENDFGKYPELTLKRFSAIQSKEGWRGCSLSHVQLIKQAYHDKLPYTIVMEDDSTIVNQKLFSAKFIEICNYLENNSSEWDVFSMCSTYSNEGNNDNVILVDKKLGLFFYQFGKTTNFMIYNQSSYEKILSLEKIFLDPTSKEKMHTIDVVMGRIGLRFLTKIPFLCVQRNGFSDITQSNDSYLSAYKANEQYLLKLSMKNLGWLGRLKIIGLKIKLLLGKVQYGRL